MEAISARWSPSWGLQGGCAAQAHALIPTQRCRLFVPSLSPAWRRDRHAPGAVPQPPVICLNNLGVYFRHEEPPSTLLFSQHAASGDAMATVHFDPNNMVG